MKKPEELNFTANHSASYSGVSMSEVVRISAREERAKKLANEVSDFLNGTSGRNEDLKVFLDVIAKDHRTLQQLFTKLCFQWIEKCSQNEFDDRNAYSVRLCKEVMKVVEEIPYKIKWFQFI
jgi:hypothetical protein